MARTEEKPLGIDCCVYGGNELLIYMMDVFNEGVSANSFDFSHGSAQNGFRIIRLDDDDIHAGQQSTPSAGLFRTHSGASGGGFETLGGVFRKLLTS